MPGFGRRGRGPHGGPWHMPPPPPPHRHRWHHRPYGGLMRPGCMSLGCMGCVVPVIAAAAVCIGGIAALLAFLF